jgi:hypothetical protein
MRFFPSLTEQFHSCLTPEQIHQRIQENLVHDFTWMSLFEPNSLAPFRGEADISGFKIERSISYRNSWLPQISGEVISESGGQGCWVRIRHRLAPSVLVISLLMPCFTCVVGIANLPFFFRLLISGFFEYDMLFPFGMFAVSLVLFVLPFWLEVRQSRPLLVKLLQLEEIT